MEVRMTLSARQELTKTIASRNKSARKAAKSTILEELCANSGYNRDYAAALLRGTGNRKQHLHSDGGSEFINYGLIAYCKNHAHPLTLTRSRVGKKNDNCYVEQKNFDTVRKLVGYARYSTQPMLETLNQVYHIHGLLLNYFYPSQKLLQKSRRGSKVIKRYDTPKTPIERLLLHPAVSPEVKQKAQAIRDSLNPFYLAAEVDRLSKLLHSLLLQYSSSPTPAPQGPPF